MNAMTVGRLHKILGKLIEQGEARRPICVNKETFHHNCEADGVVILPITDCIIRTIPMYDEDGDMKLRKDGQECERRTAILVGESYDPHIVTGPTAQQLREACQDKEPEMCGERSEP